MAEINSEFWQRVDELRGRMSVRELAEATGISEQSLQTTRSVKTMPKVKWVYTFAKLFGTTMEYLYTGEREESYEDIPLFRKLASRQEYIDICTAMVEADDVGLEMCRRALNVKKDTSTLAVRA